MTHGKSVVVPDPLWMMHVIGPDDIYPAPDHATAVQWCAYLNSEIAPKVPSVLCVAVPAIWTGTAEEHADGLAEAIKGWAVPPAPAPSSLAGGEVREYPWSFYDALKGAGIEHAAFCVNGVTVFGDRASMKIAERWHHEAISVETYWRPEVLRQRDALSPEAPAEGAGEDPRSAINSLTRSVENFDNGYEWGCDPVAVRAILRHLRARSSAPETREEALGNLLAVIHGDGGHRALEVGTKQAALEAEKIVAGLFAAPSADKLRKEVPRDQIMGVVRQYAAPAWCSVDRMADALVAIMSPAPTPDALKGDAK